MTETREDRERFMRGMLAIGCGGAPREFWEHFLETGEMDGRLWPIRWPIQWETEK